MLFRENSRNGLKSRFLLFTGYSGIVGTRTGRSSLSSPGNKEEMENVKVLSAIPCRFKSTGLKGETYP